MNFKLLKHMFLTNWNHLTSMFRLFWTGVVLFVVSGFHLSIPGMSVATDFFYLALVRFESLIFSTFSHTVYLIGLPFLFVAKLTTDISVWVSNHCVGNIKHENEKLSYIESELDKL